MKTTYKQILLVTIALLGALATTTPLMAQDGTNALDAIKLSASPERPAYRPWTVGLEAGTGGFLGGSLSWRFSDHMGVGLGIDWTELSLDHVGIAGINYNARLRLMSEPITFNWYPWKKHSFYVGLGLLLNQNELTGTAVNNGIITIDGQPFPGPLVGSLQMNVKHQLVNPYLRIGGNFFYFDRAHRWAFNGELGVAYMGESDISLNRSGPSIPAIDQAMNRAKHQLEDYVNQLQFYPVVKLAVTYSF